MSELELTWTGRALDLEWTDEPPEQEGWYWYRERYRGEYLDPVIEYVGKHYGRLKINATRGAPPVTHLDAKWAGPIPRPSDSHQDQ